ncbi:MAG: hypothetical protein GX446_17465 [Chthonomonadales bacterium]|nr:hypothetical protein [Chthonomonadales bacterium]
MAKQKRQPRASHGHTASFADAEVASLYNQADESAANQLAVLAHSEAPSRAKDARRALFLLRQRGIRADASAEPSAPPQANRATPRKLEVAAMTTLEPPGRRTIAFAATQTSQPVTAVVLDMFGAVAALPQNVDTIEELIQQDEETDDAEPPCAAVVPVDFARFRVQQAVQVNRDQGLLMPIGLSAALDRIGPPDAEYPEHPAYAMLGGLPSSWSKPSREDHVWMATITALMGSVDRRRFDELAGQVREMQHSRVLLSPTQVREMLDRSISEAIPSLYPATIRQSVIQWLEDDALVWLGAGRSDLAMHSLALAHDGACATEEHWWFLKEAVRLRLAISIVPKDRMQPTSSSSPIITPDEALGPMNEGDADSEPLIWRP